MKEKIRHIVSSVLLVLFLLPSAVKIGDTFFHKHIDSYCFSKEIQHFHQDDSACDIVVMHYSSFTPIFSSFTPVKKYIKNSFYRNFYISDIGNTNKNTFSLRGPPFLIEL